MRPITAHQLVGDFSRNRGKGAFQCRDAGAGGACAWPLAPAGNQFLNAPAIYRSPGYPASLSIHFVIARRECQLPRESENLGLRARYGYVCSLSARATAAAAATAAGGGKRPAPAAESRLRPASRYHLGHWVRPGPAKPGKRDPHPLP